VFRKVILGLFLVLGLAINANAQFPSNGGGPYTWQSQPGYVQSIQNQINQLRGAIPALPTPSNAGQFLVANQSGSALIFASISGDCTTGTAPGVISCSKTNGTSFGQLATLNIGTGLVQSGANLNVSTSNLNPMTTLGDTVYENSTPAPARLAGNITTAKEFLTQTGTGSASAAPAWAAIVSNDIANALLTPGPIGTTASNKGEFAQIMEPGATSGLITFNAQLNAGTYTLTWPSTAGAAGQAFQSDGGAGTGSTWNWIGIWTGTSGTITTGTGTAYIGFGRQGDLSAETTEASIQSVQAFTGHAANLQCFTTTACQAGGVAFTLRDNGSSSSLTCTCINTSPGGGTQCSDSTHTPVITAAHLYDIQVVNSNAANATGITGCSFIIY